MVFVWFSYVVWCVHMFGYFGLSLCVVWVCFSIFFSCFLSGREGDKIYGCGIGLGDSKWNSNFSINFYSFNFSCPWEYFIPWRNISLKISSERCWKICFILTYFVRSWNEWAAFIWCWKITVIRWNSKTTAGFRY